jgi:hypothetical protein
VVAIRTKHLAVIVPAVFVVFIGLAMALGRWNTASGRRFSDLVGRGTPSFGRGSGAGSGSGRGAQAGRPSGDGNGEAVEHDASDRIVRGMTTFGNLAGWGVEADALSRLLDGEPGPPDMTVRDWCSAKGIGFGQVKGRIQALVDAAGP